MVRVHSVISMAKIHTYLPLSFAQRLSPVSRMCARATPAFYIVTVSWFSLRSLKSPLLSVGNFREQLVSRLDKPFFRSQPYALTPPNVSGSCLPVQKTTSGINFADSVVFFNSHSHRLIGATEEQRLLNGISHIPINYQFSSWFQGGAKVHGSHVGDTSLREPTWIRNRDTILVRSNLQTTPIVYLHHNVCFFCDSDFQRTVLPTKELR